MESLGILLLIIIFTFSVGRVVLGLTISTAANNKNCIRIVPTKQTQKHLFLSGVSWIHAALAMNHSEKDKIVITPQNIYIPIIIFKLKNICIVNACQATDIDKLIGHINIKIFTLPGQTKKVWAFK